METIPAQMTRIAVRGGKGETDALYPRGGSHAPTRPGRGVDPGACGGRYPMHQNASKSARRARKTP